MAKKKRIELTDLEIDALLDTAGQMSYDMEYYKFMENYRSFIKAYERAMTKLRQARYKL